VNKSPSKEPTMGMDRKIEKKKWPPKRIAGLAAVGLFVILVLYVFLFRLSKSTLNVKTERILYQLSQGALFRNLFLSWETFFL